MTEEQFLKELSKLQDELNAGDNCLRNDYLREVIDRGYYEYLGQYGFKDKEDVDRALRYFKLGQEDPDKQVRALRLEELKEKVLLSRYGDREPDMNDLDKDDWDIADDFE